MSSLNLISTQAFLQPHRENPMAGKRNKTKRTTAKNLGKNLPARSRNLRPSRQRRRPRQRRRKRNRKASNHISKGESNGATAELLQTRGKPVTAMQNVIHGHCE